jgi:hypothetical protein
MSALAIAFILLNAPTQFFDEEKNPFEGEWDHIFMGIVVNSHDDQKKSEMVEMSILEPLGKCSIAKKTIKINDFVFTFKIESSEKDIYKVELQDKDTTFKSIMKIDGEYLLIASHVEGKDFPKEFKLTSKNPGFLYKLKKIKK